MRYLAAVLVILSCPATACDIAASELSIGGIVSGATEASVRDRLGAPTKSIETGEGTELHYPGLVVTVAWLEQAAPGVERRVLAVYGEGPNTCTPRGLCPGMAAANAARMYGRVEPMAREAGVFLEYQPAGLGCWLQVSIPEGIIKSLAVACQP